jgi:hypothetical protein
MLHTAETKKPALAAGFWKFCASLSVARYPGPQQHRASFIGLTPVVVAVFLRPNPRAGQRDPSPAVKRSQVSRGAVVVQSGPLTFTSALVPQWEHP